MKRKCCKHSHLVMTGIVCLIVGWDIAAIAFSYV